jgi:hypothetical protein
MKPHEAEVVPRETMERVAAICGPHSAAAKAIADADTAPDPSAVVFLRVKGGTILVMKPMRGTP